MDSIDIKEVPIFLLSQGGSGTNWFHKRYGRSQLSGGMKEVNPHQRNFSIPHHGRVIYLFAHPIDILLSFERRGFFDTLEAVTNLQGNQNMFRKCVGTGLEGYAQLGSNCFDFSGHLKSVVEANKDYGVLAVKYESLDINLGRVENWLKLPVVEDVPFLPRNSNHKTDERKSLIKKLNRVHKEDIEFYKAHLDFKMY